MIWVYQASCWSIFFRNCLSIMYQYGWAERLWNGHVVSLLMNNWRPGSPLLPPFGKHSSYAKVYAPRSTLVGVHSHEITHSYNAAAILTSNTTKLPPTHTNVCVSVFVCVCVWAWLSRPSRGFLAAPRPSLIFISTPARARIQVRATVVHNDGGSQTQSVIKV